MVRTYITKAEKALLFLNSLDEQQKFNMFIYVFCEPHSLKLCEEHIKRNPELDISKRMIKEIIKEIIG